MQLFIKDDINIIEVKLDFNKILKFKHTNKLLELISNEFN